MGKNDEMAATPPGSDGDEMRDDAAKATAPEESSSLDHEEREKAANLAGLSAQLRGLYKGLLEEPIPDRFTQLLKELESKESETK
jgi:Anti-sigma factor NepR